MRSARSPVVAILVAAITMLLPTAALAGDWTVGEITAPNATDVIPRAVNAHGVVVGSAKFNGSANESAFRWEDGTMIELASPGGAFQSARAQDINDDGVIVGYGATAADAFGVVTTNGVIWSATKTSSSAQLTAFSTYSGFTTSGEDRKFGSLAYGIAENGVIAGFAGWTTTSAKWGEKKVSKPATTTGGGWSVLPLPDVDTDTSGAWYGGRAYAINADGAILGSGGPNGDYARLWNSGAPYPIDLIPGLHGLNDLGHVAGRTGASNYRARLWDGSTYHEIGAAQSYSAAKAVNDSDWAVGRAGTNITNPLCCGNAYLWRLTDAPVPLFELGPAGWSMYDALDINDDGMIVGTGKHGDDAVGFWMAPASIAHTLSGTVYGPTGAPAPGVAVRILNGAGAEVAKPVTGPDGRYEATLNRATYTITAQPDGDYLPDGTSTCRITGAVCELDLSRNKTVDFYGVDIVVPTPTAPAPAPAPPPPFTPAPAFTPGPAAASIPAAPADTTGPTVSTKRFGKAPRADAKGRVTFRLGPFSEPVRGEVSLKTASKLRAVSSKTSKKKKRAKAKIHALGRTRFTAKAGKTVKLTVKLTKKGRSLLKSRRNVRARATITVRDALGNTTVRRVTVTVKAAKKKSKKTSSSKRKRR